MSDDYSFVIKGSLKLKQQPHHQRKKPGDGRVLTETTKQSSFSSSSSSTDNQQQSLKPIDPSSDHVNNPENSLLAEQPTKLQKKTSTQLAFEKARKERLLYKTKKYTAKSHKTKVSEFNEYLSRLPEHNDIPRIGPG